VSFGDRPALLTEAGQPGPAAELLALVAGHEAAERDIRDKAARMLNALGAPANAPPRSLETWVETLLAADDLTSVWPDARISPKWDHGASLKF